MVSTGIAITVAIPTALPTWTHAFCAKKVAGSLHLRKKLKKKFSLTSGSAVCVMKYKVVIGLKNAVIVGSNHLIFRQEEYRYWQMWFKLSQMQ